MVSAWEAIHTGAAPSRDGAAVRARPAVLTDAETLWVWRNDPATRANSRSSEEVPWERHLAWLESSLTRDDRLLLVADDDRGPVGTVRWDHEGGDEEVSITVAPERRGQGLAGPLLAAGERALATWTRRRNAPEGQEGTRPGCTAYLAAVHVSNAASRRLFLSSGYPPELPPDDAGFARYLAGRGRSRLDEVPGHGVPRPRRWRSCGPAPSRSRPSADRPPGGWSGCSRA